MDPLELCMGCMLPRGASEVCARCGYREGTPPESPIHLVPRSKLANQYLVGRVLGHGGFGITYIGWDLNLQRRLAIKEYFPSGVALRTDACTVGTYGGRGQQDFEYGLNRYLEEARLVARFSHHPNILSVINFFREHGTAYIVMEYLEGRTFEQYVADRGNRVDYEEAVRMLFPVMDALDEIHKEGILHRDVSPDNIHIGKDRHIKLLDFGAARIAMGERSRNLSVILKEGYAPEEQYRSKGNQGPWTDVYALAATLYRSITGVLPPGALDRMSHDELRPPRQYDPSVSVEQQDAILKALSVDLRNRFATINEFHAALDPAFQPPVRVPVESDTAAAAVRTPSQQGLTSAMAATVRKEPTVMPVPQPVSQTPPPPKPLVPVWVWGAIAGVAVIATLFVLRPKPHAPAAPATPPATVAATQPETPKPQPAAPPPASEAKPLPKAESKEIAKAPEPPKPAPPRYEELLKQALQAEGSNTVEAEKLLREATALNPARWEAYNQLAQLLLYKLDRPAEAFPAYSKAVEFGGTATFRVLHAHREGEPGEARLNITKETIGLDEPGQAPHSYTVPKTNIKELRTNRDALRRLRGGNVSSMFHIQLQTGDRVSLAGSSSKPAIEREMILRLAGQR
ncbi:MAG: serine/threonine protein kinase [Acidobacteria bacterium]|nr:serine/threonine protein kinase [Acidobacteriota bacterium]